MRHGLVSSDVEHAVANLLLETDLATSASRFFFGGFVEDCEGEEGEICVIWMEAVFPKELKDDFEDNDLLVWSNAQVKQKTFRIMRHQCFLKFTGVIEGTNDGSEPVLILEGKVVLAST